jgi:MFS family permease
MTESLRPRLSWLRLAGLTVYALALGIVLNTVDPSVLGNKALALSPDFKNSVLGLLTFAGLTMAMIWQPIVGAMSDRTKTPLGPRSPYWIAGTLGTLVALVWLGGAQSLLALFGAICLLQLALNTIQGPWQALVPDRVTPAQHGATAGFKSAFEILGFVVGRHIGGSLVAQGQTGAALSIAGGCVPLALVVTLIADRSRSTPGTLSRSFPALPVERPRGMAVWFGNRLLMWGGFILLSTFLLFYAMDVLGLSEPEAQRLVARLSLAIGVALLAVTIPAGWLSDRLGRLPLLFTAGVLAAGGTALVLVSRSSNDVLVAALLLGLGIGVFLSSSWALLTDLVPPAAAGRYLGIANIATAGGSALARLAGGLLIDPLNRWLGSTVSGYRIVYALALLGFVIGTVLLLGLRRNGQARAGAGPAALPPG